MTARNNVSTAVGDTASPARVFISYRREDSAGHAGRLYDRLSEHFGAPQVFMDIDAIEPGVDFGARIQEAIESCDVLLAIIGRRWLDVTDDTGARRLDDPGDFNRMEIETALNRHIGVIPVLVQNATMPRSKDLPASMAALAGRHAVELDDARWKYDVGRLIDAIEELSGKPSRHPVRPQTGLKHLIGQGSRKYLVSFALLATVAVVGALTVLPLGASNACAGDVAEGAGSLARSEIAFRSDRAGSTEIYGMDIDGTGQTRFTTNEVSELRPDWSPDGNKLAFASALEGSYALCVVNADRTGATTITESNTNNGAPDWAPDGANLAFSSDVDGNSDIYLVNANGTGEPRNLTNDSNHNVAPDWSPNGDLIAFASNSDGDFDIYVMEADGSGQPQRITRGRNDELAPAWSPDGNLIAYESRGGNSEILRVSFPDPQDPVNLSKSKRDDLSPSWSPSGRSLAFASNRSGDFEIYVWEQGKIRNLTNNPANDTDPAWRPPKET